MLDIKRLFGFFACILCAACVWSGSVSADNIKFSKPEIEAIVHAAKAHYLKVGKEQAFKDFMDPNNTKFRQGSMYLFGYELNGTCAIYPKPEMLGTNLIDIKDPNGVLVVKGVIDAAVKNPQGGWSEYLWKNPATNKVEKKLGFSVQLDNKYIVGSGLYESDMK